MLQNKRSGLPLVGISTQANGTNQDRQSRRQHTQNPEQEIDSCRGTYNTQQFPSKNVSGHDTDTSAENIKVHAVAWVSPTSRVVKKNVRDKHYAVATNIAWHFRPARIVPPITVNWERRFLGIKLNPFQVKQQLTWLDTPVGRLHTFASNTKWKNSIMYFIWTQDSPLQVRCTPNESHHR